MSPEPIDQPAGSPSKEQGSSAATVVVKGEVVNSAKDTTGAKDITGAKDTRPVSDAKVKMQGRLPALDDDADVGVQKDQVVTRDGKADIAFTGTLLASAAPSDAPKGKWEEYRVYETSGDKYVFSRVSRSIFAEDPDGHDAEIFEPSPSSKPAQLLRNALDLTRSHPLTWRDAAVDFFGYDPLAKALYRKLGDQFEEHIT